MIKDDRILSLFLSNAYEALPFNKEWQTVDNSYTETIAPVSGYFDMGLDVAVFICEEQSWGFDGENQTHNDHKLSIWQVSLSNPHAHKRTMFINPQEVTL